MLCDTMEIEESGLLPPPATADISDNAVDKFNTS